MMVMNYKILASGLRTTNRPCRVTYSKNIDVVSTMAHDNLRKSQDIKISHSLTTLDHERDVSVALTLLLEDM